MAKESKLKAERAEEAEGAAVPRAPSHVAERARTDSGTGFHSNGLGLNGKHTNPRNDSAPRSTKE